MLRYEGSSFVWQEGKGEERGNEGMRAEILGGMVAKRQRLWWLAWAAWHARPLRHLKGAE